jgi:CheY-like chemotaxis protein
MPTILCIDDEPTQLLMLRLALTRAGHQVIQASDGPEGIELACEEQPALVIIDLMMPQMDGATAVGRIKNNEVTAHIPVLVVSNYVTGDQGRRALENGADELISKNLSLTDIIERVNFYTRGR